MVATKVVDAAMMVPGRELTVPSGSHGATCKPNTACAERSASDDASIRCAPAPPSSAGWNTNSAVPRSCASRACPRGAAVPR
jgi:hypothetical protein